MRLWSLAFLIGILSVQQLASLPVVYYSWAGLLVFLPLVSFFFPAGYFKQVYPFAYGCLILSSGLAFGVAWGLGYAHVGLQHRLAPELEGVDIVLEGQIVSLPVSVSTSSLYSARSKPIPTGRPRRVRFDFRPSKIISPDNIVLGQFPEKLRLSWYRPKYRLQAGQYWRFTVRLKRPYGVMNPGTFDYEAYLYQKRIQARGYIRNSDYNQIITRTSSSNILYENILALRQSILNKLATDREDEGSDPFIRNLTMALVLGYRGGLDSTQWQTFQRTGTIHLMAISGLHIGLVAGLVYVFVGFLWRLIAVGCLRIPAPQAAAIAALLAAGLYAMLAGFTIPTQRALVMLVVAMMHIVVKRVPMPAGKTIALALILVLLLDPLAVLSQGFWLSFLAVSVIIFLTHAVSTVTTKQASQAADTAIIETAAIPYSAAHLRLFNKLKSLRFPVRQFVRIQWALTIVLFPVVLYFYQSSSLVSPLANFIAIPVMSLVVVPLMFIATALLFVNATLAGIVFKVIGFIFAFLWQFLETLASWDVAILANSITSPWLLVPAYPAIVLLLMIRGTPMRWLAVVLLMPAVFSAGESLKHGEARVTVLDVGQGLAVVVETRQHTLVFDTGAKYSKNFDMGKAVIVPFLRHSGIARIDTLIVSHADNDHIGGFDSTKERVEVRRLLTSVPAEFKGSGLDVRGCYAGQQWQYDGVEFTVLSPASLLESVDGHEENNQSCVLKITTRYGRVLIPGDIERETESHLYHTMAAKLAADVLLVPHHGSNTSSLAGFIKAVNPHYAVFPVGYKNRYKLPSQQVIQRYQQLTGATLLSTHKTGALSFRFQAEIALKPVRYRQIAQRYWHSRVE